MTEVPISRMQKDAQSIPLFKVQIFSTGLAVGRPTSSLEEDQHEYEQPSLTDESGVRQRSRLDGLGV